MAAAPCESLLSDYGGQTLDENRPPVSMHSYGLLPWWPNHARLPDAFAVAPVPVRGTAQVLPLVRLGPGSVGGRDAGTSQAEASFHRASIWLA